jgi:hypothetical protein
LISYDATRGGTNILVPNNVMIPFKGSKGSAEMKGIFCTTLGWSQMISLICRIQCQLNFACESKCEETLWCEW